MTNVRLINPELFIMTESEFTPKGKDIVIYNNTVSTPPSYYGKTKLIARFSSENDIFKTDDNSELLSAFDEGNVKFNISNKKNKFNALVTTFSEVKETPADDNSSDIIAADVNSSYIIAAIPFNGNIDEITIKGSDILVHNVCFIKTEVFTYYDSTFSKILYMIIENPNDESLTIEYKTVSLNTKNEKFVTHYERVTSICYTSGTLVDAPEFNIISDVKNRIPVEDIKDGDLSTIYYPKQLTEIISATNGGRVVPVIERTINDVKEKFKNNKNNGNFSNKLRFSNNKRKVMSQSQANNESERANKKLAEAKKKHTEE